MKKQITSKSNLLYWKQLLVATLLVVSFATLATAAAPSINDVIPSSGAVGVDVFIRGTNFIFPNISSNKVKFNGVKATVVEASSSIILRVKVPSGASNGPVTVLNSDGEARSPNDFTVTTSASSNKRAIGKGDRIMIKAGLSGFEPVDSKCFGKYSSGQATTNDSKSLYNAPAGSVLSVDSDADKDGNIIVSFPGCRIWGFFEKGCKEPARTCNGESVVEGNQYKISLAKVQSASSVTLGFDYGSIIVPFKYHFSDNSISGNSSIGQYIGYKISWGAASFMPVVSAGLGVVDITQQNGTTTSSSSAPSFSVCYGLIVNILKNGLFQAGIMSGWDWAGKGSQYKYEGKPWLSISLGTNWTN